MTSLVGEHLPSCYQLAEHIRDGFAIIENGGRLMHTNRALADMLGYQVEEMENLTLYSILHEDSREFHPGLAIKSTKEIILKSKTGTGILADVMTGTIEGRDKANGFYMVICPVLREQEEAAKRYLALFERTKEAVVISTLDGNIIDMNTQGLEMLGFDLDELIGQSYVDIIVSSDGEDASERFSRLLGGETIPVYERVFKRKDGTFFQAEIDVTLVSDETGEPLYLQSIVRDISQRKEIEDALRESTSAIRLLFDESPIGMEYFSADGHLVDANPAILQVFGVDKLEDVIGFDLFADPNLPEDVKEIVRSGEIARYEVEFSFEKVKETSLFETSRIGSIFLEAIITPLGIQEDGTPSGYLSQLIDITDRYKAQMDLKESEERLRRLIDTLPDAITVADLSGIFTMVSEQTAIIHGYDNPEEMKGMNGFSLTPEENMETSFAIIMKLVNGEDVGIIETMLLRKDGSTFPAEMRMSLLRDARGEPMGIMGVTRDITDRVAAEKELRDSKERLDLALKGADLGVWDWDAENNYFHFDEGYTRMLGYEEGEIGSTYSDWESLLHPDDIEAMEARWLAHVVDRTHPYSSEHRLKMKSGEYKWVLERGSVLELNDEGTTKRAAGTILDIADRKSAEVALRESEERYRRLVETSPDAIVLGDLNGNIRMANRVAQMLSGYDSDEGLIGKSFFDFVSSQDIEEAKRVMLRAIRAGREIPESIRVELVRRDNSTYPAEVNGTVVTNSEGEAESFVVVVRDITEREERERNLRESESKYRALAEQSLQGLAIMAENGIVYCNETFAEITGHSVEEILDAEPGAVWNTIHPDDRERLRERYREYMREGQRLGSTQYRINRPDGETRWVESFVSIITYAGKQAMQSSIIDITERHLASEARKRAEEELRNERDRAQLYLDMAEVIFLVLDTEGRITLLNKKGCDVLACKPSDVFGSNWFNYVPERERVEVRAAFNRLMSGSLESIEKQERHILTFTNEERLIEWNTVVLKDDAGQIIGLISSGEDITEKRWAENALRESEERYRTLVQSMQDMVFVYDENDRQAEFYGADKELLLTTPEEFLGKHITETLPRERAESILVQIQNVRKTGEATTYDYPLEIHGSKHWFSAKISRHEDGRNVISVVRDITQRVLAEETISRERRAFKLIAESAVYSKSIDDLCSQILTGLIETLGFEKGTVSLFDSEASSLVTRASFGMKDEMLSNTVPVNEAASRRYITSMVALNNSPVFAPDVQEEGTLDIFDDWLKRLEIRSAIVWPLLDDEKKLLGVLGIASGERQELDEESRVFFETVAEMFALVLEKQRSREALVIAEEKFRSIFHTIPIGLQLLEKDVDGTLRLIDANPAVDSVLRLPSKPLIGKPVDEIAPRPAKDAIIEQCKRVVEQEIQWDTEDVIEEEEQVVRAVKTSIFPVLPGMIAISLLDLTERVQAEREVLRLNEQLNELVEERTIELASANKELEAFAYTVSHDLRAPLRVMDGFSQALLEDYERSLDTTASDYLQRIRQAANRMASLIDDILELSRVTRLEMDRVSVNLSLMAEEVIKDLRESEPDRVVEVVVKESMRSRCDRRLMRAILQNLLGNAWKFTSPTEKPKVEFGSLTVEDEIVYYVKDNGVGFAMDSSEKLFKPFQRLHPANEFEGSGIGLATVERAINRHGGRIWADSELGKGATFFFTLKTKSEDAP